MYAYRDYSRKLYFAPARYRPPAAPSELQTDWGEVIGRGMLIVGGLALGAAILDSLFRSSKVPRRTAPRDTFRYELWQGSRRVQFGITNDPDRRSVEHLSSGKQFSAIGIVGPAVTRASARTWERSSIEAYARQKGRRPRYNKSS
jgi:hypothetical protein